jgi:uncharacterized protein (DUF488 family)
MITAPTATGYLQSTANQDLRGSPVSQRHVYTIGYEGADLATFLARLTSAKIAQVIDVRELPLSRKRGFSKSALAAALTESGIRYLHLRDLGDPKPGREAARRGDHTGFLRIYKQHLAGPAAQKALAEASRQASAVRSCLLCFERDHEGCHRAIVAEAMSASTGLEVTHLRVVPPARHTSRGNDEQHAAHVW